MSSLTSVSGDGELTSHILDGPKPKWWKDSGLRRLMFWQLCILVSQATVGYDESLVGSFQAMQPWVEGDSNRKERNSCRSLTDDSYGTPHKLRCWAHHFHFVRRWLCRRLLCAPCCRQLRSTPLDFRRIIALYSRSSYTDSIDLTGHVYWQSSDSRTRHQLHDQCRPYPTE